MGYIWEKYSFDKKFVIPKRFSPYIETMADNGRICELNPLLRFSEIFNAGNFIGELSGIFDLKETENTILHFLVQLDLLNGLNRKQVKINALDKKISDGGCGNKIRDWWQILKPKHREIILSTLVDKLDSVTVNNHLCMAASKIFKMISMTYEKSSGIYYFYINAQGNDYNKTVMNALRFLFQDMQNRLEIVWDKHYGIIGNDSTMKISEIQIL